MIGLFDSGIGGIPIFQAVRRLLPQESLIYVADTGYVPYGDKPKAYIVDRSTRISQFLIDQGTSLIIIACNTATTAAISHLRSHFSVPFIGVEPAIKPALTAKSTYPITILATDSTLHSPRLQQLISSFPSQRSLYLKSLPNWVQLAETGHISGGEVITIVKNDLSSVPFSSHLVLACTHYLHFKPIIASVRPDLIIHDPITAVARRTADILPKSPSYTPTSPPTIYTTAPIKASVILRLLGDKIPVKLVHI